ncbi:unnamed protein product [Adineta steineri]|uniref:Uncharacterized protein n=1 Tax=Adineta steineri TaxID=433720 RepID=A0A815MJG9_9BILA|nr:unnamed protein product [Adineta steineri]CAF1417209.1 unnamed protein product [Adineta steineri]
MSAIAQKGQTKQVVDGGVYLQGSIKTSYPKIRLDIPKGDESREWSIYLYILTECLDHATYYIHPNKAIFNSSFNNLNQDDAVENDNCLCNPHVVKLTEHDIINKTFEIKVKVITKKNQFPKKNLRLTKFHTEEPFQNVHRQSPCITETFDDFRGNFTDFRGNLTNFHLACVLTRDNETYGLCISDLVTTYQFGNVFRIESVEKFNDQIWYCKLCINSDDESELTRMFQHYETEIGTSLTYLSLGVYLNGIGRKDMAVQYYESLLKVETDFGIISSIHNNLATINRDEKYFLSAQDYWNQVPNAQKIGTFKTFTPQFEQKSQVIMADLVPDTSPIINCYNLAYVYRVTGRFDEALNACEQALSLTTAASDPINIARVHSARASVYFSQEKYEDALKSYRMALDIALVHLSTADPLIDQYLNNVRLLNNKINEKQS